jgi:hypothetical protein
MLHPCRIQCSSSCRSWRACSRHRVRMLQVAARPIARPLACLLLPIPRFAKSVCIRSALALVVVHHHTARRRHRMNVLRLPMRMWRLARHSNSGRLSWQTLAMRKRSCELRSRAALRSAQLRQWFAAQLQQQQCFVAQQQQWFVAQLQLWDSSGAPSAVAFQQAVACAVNRASLARFSSGEWTTISKHALDHI